MKNKEKSAPETEKEIVKDIEKSGVPEKQAVAEEKIDEKETEKFKVSEKKSEEIKKGDKKAIKKKTEAVLNAKDLPISTKVSASICKMIKGKEIIKAIRELEEVISFKKAVPMKGEIPHRKGQMHSGRYPVKAAENFIILLKSLSANADVNGLENPVITEVVANNASRPFGRFGRVRKKRTHVKIVARNMEVKK